MKRAMVEEDEKKFLSDEAVDKYERQANYANLDELEEMVLMAYTDMLGGDRDEVWFIDSGCSNHMCGDLSLLCDLEKGFNKVVRLGNYASMNVVEKGSVRLTVKGVNHLVRDVYYVPRLKNNLLSVGKLRERGLAVLMQSNMCRIYHHIKGLIFKITMVANRMFMWLSNTQSIKKERAEECLQERSFEDDRRFDLEWEDGNGEEVENSDDGSEEENIASPVRDESSDGNEEDEAAPPMTPRVRREPAYLNDFVSGDGLSDEGEEFCGTRQQIADIFTKLLKLKLFRELRRRFEVCELPHVNKLQMQSS
ncbi:hypothetical protein KIW84_051843 [Lathyrus oleraceus]|uniref:Retrovirus-related Pol polyprotein from transposon TNT 1-94-like beta-barrel domain-containing protein n=1 Tax=Pisum sativum TaxID=3888 RepID=A0A9D4WQ73_PEA|nr:hypothetical protein KIW84_051843 [Pisum sativum]